MRAFAFALMLCIQPLSAAFADPLPPALASAGVTQSDWDALQGEVREQARLRGYSESVVRQLATEVLQAQPGQPFSVYADMLKNAAARLVETQAALRALNPGDNEELIALRARAAEAAAAGRLRDALRLQDQYVTTLRDSLQALVDQPYLELAAAMAASADTAAALGDNWDAARRYHQAAETVPATSPLVRWRYLLAQGRVLWEQGSATSMRGRPDYRAIDAGLRVLIDEALPLVPRETHPREWSETAESVSHLCDLIASPNCGREAEFRAQR